MRNEVGASLADHDMIEVSEDVTTCALAVACRPDVIVLDATDVARAEKTLDSLRRDFRSAFITTVFIVESPPVSGKIAAAFGGSDDYVVCPFEADELAARVEVSARRAGAHRSVNPLTGLPGNGAVTDEIGQRLAGGEPFSCLYADLDDFKGLNDKLGFARGDDVIRSAARCIVDALDAETSGRDFVGHVGGDDFVVLTGVDRGEAVARAIIERFDALEMGCSISIGLVSGAGGETAVAGLAAEAKGAAKRASGSSWAAIDVI